VVIACVSNEIATVDWVVHRPMIFAERKNRPPREVKRAERFLVMG
jgi:hypothetical protein